MAASVTELDNYRSHSSDKEGIRSGIDEPSAIEVAGLRIKAALWSGASALDNLLNPRIEDHPSQTSSLSNVPKVREEEPDPVSNFLTVG